MGNFAFSLGERVSLIESNEEGTVVGRAEYTDMAPRYLVRYKGADGRLVEEWWSGEALKFVE